MYASLLSNFEEPPDHYRPIDPKSNRFSDVMGRMRINGPWEVGASIALEQLASENPSLCMNREFVRELLARAAKVSPAEHDEWLRETAMDRWTYDCDDPRPPFDEYFAALKRDIYRPDDGKKFRSDTQTLYAIEGLPNLYLLQESTCVEQFDEPFIESRHFIDLDSVVAPLSLASCAGTARYIL